MRKAFAALGLGLLCAYGVALASACSSSNSTGGTPEPTTTVDSTKQAGSLSDADKQKLCQDVLAFQNGQITDSDRLKQFCLSQALTQLAASGSLPPSDSQLQSECNTAYQKCLSQPAGTVDAGAAPSDCSGVNATLLDCTATVGQITTCIGDQVALAKTAYAKFDTVCNTILLDGGGGIDFGSTEPASCSAIASTCPHLLGK